MYIDKQGNLPIHYAAKYGRVSVVRWICSRCDKVNYANVDGLTAAHLAAACGSLQIIECLGRSGAELMTADNVMWTPFHYALKYKHKDIIAYLMGNNCPTEESDLAISAVVHMATVTKNVEMVQLLVESGFGLEVVNHMGWNLLHFAAAAGDEVIVKIVCEKLGKDGNLARRDEFLRTPVIHAAINGHVNVIEIIEGVTENVLPLKDKFGKGALHYAAEFDRRDVAAYIAPLVDLDDEDVNGMTALHFAAMNGNTAVVKVLVEDPSRINVNAVDKQGRTPAYLACEKRCGWIIGMLAAAGGDMDIFPENGRSLISCSITSHDSPMVEQLISMMVDQTTIFKPDCQGWSPVHYAAQLGRVRIVQILHEIKSESLMEQDINLKTPLHIAVSWNQKEVVDLFVGLPAFDLDMQDAAGDTALHLAARSGNVEIACILLNSTRCNPNVSNKDGDAPIHVAVKSWATDVVSHMILNDRCLLNAQDDAGMTAYLLAARLGQRSVIRVLTRTDAVDASAVDKMGRCAEDFLGELVCPLDFDETSEVMNGLNENSEYDRIQYEEEEESGSEVMPSSERSLADAQEVRCDGLSGSESEEMTDPDEEIMVLVSGTGGNNGLVNYDDDVTPETSEDPDELELGEEEEEEEEAE